MAIFRFNNKIFLVFFKNKHTITRNKEFLMVVFTKCCKIRCAKVVNMEGERGMEWIFLFLIGFFAATLGSIIGLGGGIIIIPILTFMSQYTPFFHEVTPQYAVGVSTITIVMTALSASLANRKKKTIAYRMGIYLFIGAAPGAFFGAYTNKFLDFSAFSLYYGVFLIIAAGILMLKSRIRPLKLKMYTSENTYTDNQGITHTYIYSPVIGIPLAFCVGFISGIFGIGGGTLLVPGMMLFFGVPAIVAAATSMFVILGTSILNTIQQITYDHVIWMYVLFLIPGAWIGGIVGPYISSKIKGRTIVILLQATMIIIGIQFIIQALLK